MFAFINRFFWLTAFFVSMGCEWNVGVLDVHLIYSARPGKNPLSQDLNVRTVRIRVEGDDLSPRESEFVVGTGGQIEDVPVGKTVRVLVTGLDSIGQVLSRGESGLIELQRGSNHVYVFIGLLGEFSHPSGGSGFSRIYSNEMRETGARAFHSALTLPDKKILIAGGTQDVAGVDYLALSPVSLRSAERFDPFVGAFVRDQGLHCPAGLCLSLARSFHAAQKVPNSDNLLLFGGEPIVDSVDTYDSSAMTFAATTSLAFEQPRSRQAQTLLYHNNDGLLVAGGISETGAMLAGIELLLPGTAGFHRLSSDLSVARSGAVAVAYSGGVLIIGGWERFDPWVAGIPKRIASSRIDRIRFNGSSFIGVDSIQPLVQARAEHTAVLVRVKKRDSQGQVEMAGGQPVWVHRVLVCGGLTDAILATDTCELIDPVGGKVVLVESMYGERWCHTATVLNSGEVLIAGGFRGGAPGPAAHNTAVLLDPDSVIRGRIVSMISGRAGHTATLLESGMVLLVGGRANPTEMATSDYEIYVPK
jgi:hypothetical protein